MATEQRTGALDVYLLGQRVEGRQRAVAKREPLQMRSSSLKL